MDVEFDDRKKRGFVPCIFDLHRGSLSFVDGHVKCFLVDFLFTNFKVL